MRRRRRGVGILGVAAVAGVAHHAGKKSAQANAQEQDQEQRLEDLEAQEAEAPAPIRASTRRPAPVAAGLSQEEKFAQLKQLADLKTMGALTEEEFAAEKAKILAQ